MRAKKKWKKWENKNEWEGQWLQEKEKWKEEGLMEINIYIFKKRFAFPLQRWL